MRGAFLSILLFSSACCTAPFIPIPGDPPPTGKIAQYPPDRFKHTALFLVTTIPRGDVDARCRASSSSTTTTTQDILACSSGVFVFVPNPCEFPGDFYAEILCHEQGHVDGWNRKHSN